MQALVSLRAQPLRVTAQWLGQPKALLQVDLCVMSGHMVRVRSALIIEATAKPTILRIESNDDKFWIHFSNISALGVVRDESYFHLHSYLDELNIYYTASEVLSILQTIAAECAAYPPSVQALRQMMEWVARQ